MCITLCGYHLCISKVSNSTCSVPGEVPILNVSYKPQKISPKFKVRRRAIIRRWVSWTLIQTLSLSNTSCVCGCVSPQGSVRALLHEKIRDAYTHPQFVTDVMKPMQIDSIIDQDVSTEFWKLFSVCRVYSSCADARYRFRTCPAESCRE